MGFVARSNFRSTNRNKSENLFQSPPGTLRAPLWAARLAAIRREHTEDHPMLEFQVGDKAVYPAQGVAEVVGIDQKEISGRIQKFYVLRVLDSDMRILVPTDKAEQVGLRGVVNDEQLEEVYDILKE